MKSIILISIAAMLTAPLSAQTPYSPFFTKPANCCKQGFKTYIVKKGDSWKSIFMKQYGLEPENSVIFEACVNTLLMESHHNVDNPANESLETGSQLFLVPLLFITETNQKRIYQPLEPTVTK